MVVLLTCKNEEDPIKNRGARVFTTLLVGGSPQPDSAQAVDGMRHIGFRVLLVLLHGLCYKNYVILNDQSNISWLFIASYGPNFKLFL